MLECVFQFLVEYCNNIQKQQLKISETNIKTEAKQRTTNKIRKEIRLKKSQFIYFLDKKKQNKNKNHQRNKQTNKQIIDKAKI